ncbi:MAG: hypothetical protein CL927_20365 [Deltaproteobacteria bacterium]|nr:hypothetical protein [Deltaproteobacteria bacterium]HCH63704.1 hypothetical protein [Deltaproteobacteria bacterium]|tara:strand:+ start:94 stop:546 length:453 start_codon:yes stop_codon:yes gene_type:complete
MRTIQFTALALVLGAGVACKSKTDSGESGTTAATTGGTTGGSTAVGNGTGSYGLTLEGNCSIGWDVAGTYNGDGASYSWDAALTVNAGLTDCANAADTSGALAASSGEATFAGNYIGTYTATANSISWETSGYVAGGGGGSYAYDGNISW